MKVKSESEVDQLCPSLYCFRMILIMDGRNLPSPISFFLCLPCFPPLLSICFSLFLSLSLSHTHFLMWTYNCQKSWTHRSMLASRYMQYWDFPHGSVVKNLPAMQEMQVPALGWEDPLENEMAIHFSFLAWKIVQTQEPGGLQSMKSPKSQMLFSNSTTTTHAILKHSLRVRHCDLKFCIITLKD